MGKENRHILIRNTIKQLAIANQAELLDVLIQHGFDVTQATLSRDIKELGLIKAPNKTGDYIYQLTDNILHQEREKTSSSFKFLAIEFSGHMAVAKTKPGYAMALAGEIDKDKLKTILGTVAGDDTILLIKKEECSREELLEELKHFLPNNLL